MHQRDMKYLVLVLTLILATPAFAAEEARVVRQPDRTAYKKKSFVSFSEVQLTGELVKPSSTLVHARGSRAKFRSLIRLRGDFRPELLASVDAL